MSSSSIRAAAFHMRMVTYKTYTVSRGSPLIVREIGKDTQALCKKVTALWGKSTKLDLSREENAPIRRAIIGVLNSLLISADSAKAVWNRKLQPPTINTVTWVFPYNASDTTFAIESSETPLVLELPKPGISILPDTRSDLIDALLTTTDDNKIALPDEWEDGASRWSGAIAVPKKQRNVTFSALDFSRAPLHLACIFAAGTTLEITNIDIATQMACREFNLDCLPLNKERIQTLFNSLFSLTGRELLFFETKEDIDFTYKGHLQGKNVTFLLNFGADARLAVQYKDTHVTKEKKEEKTE